MRSTDSPGLCGRRVALVRVVLRLDPKRRHGLEVIIVMTEPRLDAFAWMLDRRNLRPSLRTIGRTVRSGGIVSAPPGHRHALVDGLEALLDAPDLTNREAELVARLLATIDAGV
jgi:hypothetical protein